MEELGRNPLREVGDGGVGFCYDVDRPLFAGSGLLQDGPLLLALDSNVMFDIELYGSRLIDGESICGLDDARLKELDALGELLDLWLVRDIRFVVLPSIRSDYRRSPSADRLKERERLFSALELALLFHTGHWETDSHDFFWKRASSAEAEAVLTRVRGDLDRRMVRAAWDCAADVFLTSDEGVLVACTETPSDFPNVLRPTQLLERLESAGVTHFNGGRLNHPDCRWAASIPFGDIGRWVGLLQALEDADARRGD